LLFKKLFKFLFKGKFENGHPAGPGTLSWSNGDECSGQMKNGICSGKRRTSAGVETEGIFDWSFDHDDHSFKFGK
jgi:hypothetical protein